MSSSLFRLTCQPNDCEMLQNILGAGPRCICCTGIVFYRCISQQNNDIWVIPWSDGLSDHIWFHLARGGPHAAHVHIDRGNPCLLCVAWSTHVSPVFGTEWVSGLRRFCCSPTIQQPARHSEVICQAGRQTPHRHFLGHMWIRQHSTFWSVRSTPPCSCYTRRCHLAV